MTNVNISGGQNQNQFGDHNTQNMINNIQGNGISFEQLLQVIKEGLAADLAADEVAAIDKQVLEPLREVGAQPEPENEQDRTTLRARIGALLEKLEPYAPYIRRTLAAFAEGALSTIPPPAGWVVAGVVEVVRDARSS